MHYPSFQIRDNIKEIYSDVYTPEALRALEALAHFNNDIKKAMQERIERRTQRIRQRQRITFLDSESFIPGTDIRVQDARDGWFEGAVIPADLQRQWIQGTGPAAKPQAPVESSMTVV